jgi:hypothetical protein
MGKMKKKRIWESLEWVLMFQRGYLDHVWTHCWKPNHFIQSIKSRWWYLLARTICSAHVALVLDFWQKHIVSNVGGNHPWWLATIGKLTHNALCVFPSLHGNIPKICAMWILLHYHTMGKP